MANAFGTSDYRRVGRAGVPPAHGGLEARWKTRLWWRSTFRPAISHFFLLASVPLDYTRAKRRKNAAHGASRG